MPAPFLSVIIDDCIANGRDYNAGGARYNTSYIQGVGIGTLTDSLAAITQHRLRATGRVELPELLAALDADFEGTRSSGTLVRNRTPKYGNDDDCADELMRRGFRRPSSAMIDGRPNGRGGRYRINMLPTTCHVYFGSVTGATPDGRKAAACRCRRASRRSRARTARGRRRWSKSAAKMDHGRTGGTLLNMKFTPAVLEGDEGIDKLAQPGADATSSWTATTSSSTSSAPRPCARPRSTRTSTAT